LRRLVGLLLRLPLFLLLGLLLLFLLLLWFLLGVRAYAEAKHKGCSPR